MPFESVQAGLRYLENVSTMGAAGSVSDYETAEKNSDASASPPAFAEVSKAVAEKKAAGAGDAELLAFAESECASKALTVHLDKEYSASTGRGRLHVTCLLYTSPSPRD